MTAYYKTGLHVGECIGQFMGQSESEKQTPYFALKFKIVARVENEKECPVEAGERTVYLYLSEAALEMTIDAVTYLGFDKDSVRFLNPDTQNFYNFAGKVADLWCKIEEYKGQSKEKWSISLPRKPATPIDDKDMRRLDDLFGKAIKSRIPMAPRVQAPAASAEPAPEPKSGNGVIPGVSPQQRANAGVGRADPTKAPTEDEIPF